VVADAGGADSKLRRVAVDELCQNYWPPIYAFLRRRGLSPSEAEDVTQDFFVDLISDDRLITTADPGKGKFRTYVIAAIKNRVANRVRSDRAAKRGGRVEHLSFDRQHAESNYLAEPTDHWTAEAIFNRSWAIAVLQSVLNRLAQNYAEEDREAWFATLRPYLTTTDQPAYAVVAEQLSTTEAAARVSVCRLRKQYREELLQEIRSTLGPHEDVAAEQAELLRALQGPD